jgi:putative acetyltransferase
MRSRWALSASAESQKKAKSGNQSLDLFDSIGVIKVREEDPDDVAAVRDLNRRAFGQDQESNIVDALRANGAALLSLVATLNDRVVGHIMYSRAVIGGSVRGAALGPMAVLPEFQRQGIGSELVEAGNQKLKDSGCPFIIVVGHADYYPRFGFRPASEHGIQCEWDVPGDVFMLLVLDQAKMEGVAGLAKYRHEFSSVS